MGHLDHEYRKVKTSPKINLSEDDGLTQKIFNTIQHINKIVGTTLGPHGRPIIIEKLEPGLPPYMTKDGVTVIKSMAYDDPVQQIVLEVLRDSAIKTVELAGDGTSTSTVLSYGLVREMFRFLNDNRTYSSQMVMREIQDFTKNVLLPAVAEKAVKITPENQDTLLRAVATISSNGDKQLANAVLDCFELAGDAGHITIAEEYGSGFEVSKIKGFPMGTGWENSLNIFYNEFVKEENNGKINLENVRFVLIDGKIQDIGAISNLIGMLEQEAIKAQTTAHYVLMAKGYSREFLQSLAKIWNFQGGMIKILPLVIPIDGYPNCQHEFLVDLGAFTGSKVFNSLTVPASKAVPSDLGDVTPLFECSQYKSVVLGSGNAELILNRAKDLKGRIEHNSKLMTSILQERIGKLTGGIAKLVVKSLSETGLRETKDRAEDAICAVKGALKSGVLPGGGRILLNLSMLVEQQGSKVVKEVLGTSLREPFLRMLRNSGLSAERINEISYHLINNPEIVYEIISGEFGDPFELGLFDSAPAVSESLKAAVEISTNLGTAGGMICFPRNNQMDMADGKEKAELYNNMNNEYPSPVME